MTQNILDPKQQLTLQYYRDPTSETFGNLKQSLLKAGYSPSYAQSAHGQVSWIHEGAQKDVERVQKAESNIDKYLHANIDLKELRKKDIDVARLQFDASRFILKTVARKKYTEEKEEKPTQVQVNIVNYSDKEPEVKVSQTLPNTP